jgi:hypothetical protein
MATKAKTVIAALFAAVTSLSLIWPADPHWLTVVPAIMGVLGVYAVPNARQPSSFLTTVPGTVMKVDYTGEVTMTEPTTDPYASARLMGVTGIPPLPEKPKEDSPEIAELKAQIAKLTGTATASPAESPADTAAVPAGLGIPVTTAAAPAVAPENFINNVASRLRASLSDITQIVEDLEAGGVKF